MKNRSTRRLVLLFGCLAFPLVVVLAALRFVGSAQAPEPREDGASARLVTENAQLRAKIAVLEKELLARDAAIARGKSEPTVAESTPGPTAAPGATSVPTPPPAAAAESRADFWAEETTRWVEGTLALKPAERELLKRRLREASLAGNTDLQSVYEDALGGERAAELKKQELEEDAAEQREEIEQEVFTLSRKLVLTPEQEGKAREALLEVQELLQPIEGRMQAEQKRAMALHRSSETQADPTELYAIYRLLQELKRNADGQRREYLVTKLKQSLSDTQLNALVEYEAQRAE